MLIPADQFLKERPQQRAKALAREREAEAAREAAQDELDALEPTGVIAGRGRPSPRGQSF